MIGNLANALRGIGGEFEINRVLGFILGILYGLGGIGFQAWNIANGQHFDPVAFFASFAAGAAVIIGATAGAVAHKDKAVAAAKVTEATGSKPADPPAPAPHAQPGLAQAATGEAELDLAP